MRTATRRTFLASLTAALAAACTKPLADDEPIYGDRPAAGARKDEYIFAPLPVSNPAKLFEVYQPLADIINAQAKGFVLKLESSQHYADFEHKLATRRVHFGMLNPYQTVRSEAHGYRIFGKMGDDHRFRGLIVVRRDSTIKTVADLRNQPVSFPAPTAVAGCMMPKLFLKQQGLDVETEADVRYVGSQESAVMNVAQGITKAGCVWQQSWDGLEKDQPQLVAQLEVKWQTETLQNNGLVARDDVPGEHLRFVSGIIFKLHESDAGREILKRMELSRFEAATSATYEPMRRFLKQYEEAFGRPPVPKGEL